MTEENLTNSTDKLVASGGDQSSTNEPPSLHSEIVGGGGETTIDSTIEQLGGCGESTGPCTEGSPLRILIKTMTHPDMRVRCCSNCLVKKLKCHIAKGFPTHPKVDDQKLISSGMLLHDDMTIKSALRIHLTPEKPADEDYIIHLVCNVKSSSVFKRQQSTNINNSNTNNSNNSSNASAESGESGDSVESGAGSSSETIHGSGSDERQTNRSLPQSLSELSSDQYAKILADMHKQHQAYFESMKSEVRKNFDSRKPDKNLVKQFFQTYKIGNVAEPSSSDSGTNLGSSEGSHDENNNSRENTEVQNEIGG